jgi:TM2 domain-containing membrane protein YozV
MSDEDETAAPVDAPGADPAYTAAAVAAAAVNNQQQAQWQQQQAQQAQWQQQQAQQQAQWQQQQAWQQQQQQAQWQQQQQQQAYYQQPYAGPAPASPAEKSKVAAGLLGIFLGSLGIHKFYLGMTKPGLIMLLVTLIAGIITFGLAAVAMEVIGIIEGIMYLTKSDQEFYYTYVVGKKEWF